MGHGRPHGGLALVVRRHRDDAAKDFERATIPVFDYIVMSGEAGIDERAQILADRLAPVPIGNAEVTDGILREAVEAFTEGLVVDLLPEGQQPVRGSGFREGLCAPDALQLSSGSGVGV